MKPSRSDFDPVKPLDLTAERAKLEATAKEQHAKLEKEKADAAAKEKTAEGDAASPKPAEGTNSAEAPKP